MRRVASFASRLATKYAALNSPTVTAVTSGHTTMQRLWHGAALAQTPSRQAMWLGLRSFSTGIDVSKEVDAVNELFTAARDEIEYAKEEAETVYFNESVAEARKAVDSCMGRWEALLAALPEEERNRVVRSMGLKMAQLQAEYDEVSKLHLEE